MARKIRKAECILKKPFLTPKNVDDVLEMKDTTIDAEGEHDEGSEDGKKKGGSHKMFGFFN